MKQIKAEKELFDNLLGLSCVENYFLYICQLEKVEYRYLYAKSYISISDIVSSFYDDLASYATFNNIMRLQDVAKKHHIIEYNVEKDYREHMNQYDYCCISVTNEFVNERYNRELWRDDHFILICKEESDEWICLNDIPRECFSLKKMDVDLIYGGQSVCFKSLFKIDKNEKEILFHEFVECISKEQNVIKYDIDNFLILRDIVGILRITRKRVKEYCSLYVDTSFMDEFLNEIDKFYVIIEYMRLRGKYDYQKINNLLNRIQISDIEIIKKLYERMEKLK